MVLFMKTKLGPWIISKTKSTSFFTRNIHWKNSYKMDREDKPQTIINNSSQKMFVTLN